MRDFVTKEELAARHKVGLRTIDCWIREKNLPFLKFGKDIVFKESDLETWGREQAQLSNRGIKK